MRVFRTLSASSHRRAHNQAFAALTCPDLVQHMPEPNFRIDTTELAGGNFGVEHGTVLGGDARTDQQVIFAAQCNRSNDVYGQVDYLCNRENHRTSHRRFEEERKGSETA